MTFAEAKDYAERLLREAGYTGPVEWLRGRAPSVARFYLDESVEVYIDASISDEVVIDVTLHGKTYAPLEWPDHRAAAVAMLARVLRTGSGYASCPAGVVEMNERLVPLTEDIWVNPDHVTALGRVYRNGVPEHNRTHVFVVGVDDPFCLDQPPQEILKMLQPEPNKREEQ